MRKVRLLALAAFTAALGCASRPVSPTSTPTPTPGSTATATPTAGGGAWASVARGMDAAEVRRRLGDPRRAEKIPSAAVQGARYERWSYGAGEVVLVDGKVIDVLP